jgi:hypothetical protein
MSRRVTPTELTQIRKRLAENYVPISPRTLEGWTVDWNSALARIHYVKAGRFSIADSLGAMVKVRGGVQVRGPLFEMSRPDIERVWQEDVAKGLRAFHAIEDRQGGYDFHFAALDDRDQYVTGTLTVVRMEGT